MAAEGNLRKKLKARVEAYGGEIRAVSWIGRRSAPDVLCLFPHGSRFANLEDILGGRHLHPFVETKCEAGVPTAAQAREHERMRQSGCVVLVISTEEQLDAWLAPL